MSIYNTNPLYCKESETINANKGQSYFLLNEIKFINSIASPEKW